jgi:hypothetical protein
MSLVGSFEDRSHRIYRVYARSAVIAAFGIDGVYLFGARRLAQTLERVKARRKPSQARKA